MKIRWDGLRRWLAAVGVGGRAWAGGLRRFGHSGPLDRTLRGTACRQPCGRALCIRGGRGLRFPIGERLPKLPQLGVALRHMLPTLGKLAFERPLLRHAGAYALQVATACCPLGFDALSQIADRPSLAPLRKHIDSCAAP